MSDKESVLNTVVAFVGSAFTFLFGGVDAIFIALISMMIVNVVVGVIKALYNKNLNSDKMLKGLINMFFCLCIIFVGHLLDNTLEINIFRNLVCWYYIAYYGLSIVENIGGFISLPTALKKFLENLKDQNDDVDIDMKGE